MYRALDAYMEEFNPGLVVLDVLADVFAGDESKRVQVRQFVNLLKRLCRKHESAILLLAHPSLAGISSGTGMSGSTYWNNAVRSRLYLQTKKASNGSEPLPRMRTFQGMKTNYGELGGAFDIEWKNGVLIPIKKIAGFDKLAQEQKADDTFLKLVAKYERENRSASSKIGGNFAPRCLIKTPTQMGCPRMYCGPR